MKKALLKCKICKKNFKSVALREKHTEEKHSEHISFVSLVNDYQNWGKNYVSKKDIINYKNSPPTDDLMLGYLQLICNKLTKISNQLDEEKTIKLVEGEIRLF